MKTPALPEEDLHAYADGQLPAARASEMAAWLEQDPAHAEAPRTLWLKYQALQQAAGKGLTEANEALQKL